MPTQDVKGKAKFTGSPRAPDDFEPVSATGASEEDSEASSASQPAQKQSRTPAAPEGDRQYPWRNGHQQTLAEFWQNNPVFYDKSQQHYKNKAMRIQLMQELIEQNREEWEKIHTPLPSVIQMDAHLRNMRTRFVKLMKRKSFAPALKLSYTDQQIWERYQFLCPHIQRNRTTSAHSFHVVQVGGEVDDDDDEVVDDDGDDGQSEPGSQQPSILQTHHKWKGKRRRPLTSPSLSPVSDSEDMYEMEILQQAKNLISNIRTPTKCLHERRVRDFCRYLESELLQVPESSWDDCSFTVMSTIRGFKQQAHVAMPHQQMSSQNGGGQYQEQQGGYYAQQLGSIHQPGFIIQLLRANESSPTMK